MHSGGPPRLHYSSRQEAGALGLFWRHRIESNIDQIDQNAASCLPRFWVSQVICTHFLATFRPGFYLIQENPNPKLENVAHQFYTQRRNNGEIRIQIPRPRPELVFYTHRFIINASLRHCQRGNMARPSVPKPPATTTYSLDSPTRRKTAKMEEGWGAGA
jgi:hypothetical protein